jgi:hypothetical protein
LIIIKIIGGLTSQMHKYALGRVLSLKHNVPLKLDLTWFEDTKKTDTPWPYQLDYFYINADIATKDEINKLKGNDKYITFARRLKYYLGINIYKKSYINTSFLSIDNFNKLGSSVYLDGEWSGFKYFENYQNEIKKDFRYKIKISPEINNILKILQNENSVSLHIRRGDFISHPDATSFHAICGLSYYENSIKYILNRVKSPVFYVFSDDIQWAKEHLNNGYNIKFIEGNTNYEDLLLMSECKHNITANSGFSAWAGWLNSNIEKIVISPTKWVKDGALNETIISSLQSDSIVFIEN